MTMVRGRFAPSPSGRMHLGNLFCCLLAWLSVRSQGGQMVLRIEDLDTQRCSQRWTDQLQQDLLWLGLDWDEGGGFDFCQSHRTALYQEALDRLAAQGLVYPCFCTRAQLHAVSAPHRSDGRTVYSGACYGLSSEEIQRLMQNRSPAMRLHVPDERLSFTDGHMGRYSESLRDDCGDFLLRRSDGLFAYQLAVVVDDAAMGITEVVRGSDLLSSTPRQLLLYRLLDLTPPRFCHLPLLLNQDGRRLSKRERDISLEELSKRHAAEEIVGRLAYLAGLNPTAEAGTPASFIPAFSWTRIPVEDIRIPTELFA